VITKELFTIAHKQSNVQHMTCSVAMTYKCSGNNK